MDALLPEGLSAVNATAVIVISFLSSALTGAFGIGGGLMLLAAMSALFPPAAVIPVHGVAQLSSNLSRFAMLRRHTVWPLVGWFALGGAAGAFVGANVFVALPVWALRIGVALFILVMVWAPKPKGFAPGVPGIIGVGAFSGFLTMFFGATGPIAATVIGATGHDRMKIVGTHAAVMVGQHAMKIAAFGLIGFAFAAWAFIIIGIIAATSAGAWAGTRILHNLPEKQFQFGFKIILSLVSLYLLGVGLLAAFTPPV